MARKSDYGRIDEKTKMQNSKQPPAGFPGSLSQGNRGPANRHGFMGGGYGSGAFEHLQSNGVTVVPYKGAERSHARAKDRKLGFANRRSEAWWMLREALDPDQVGGSAIILPPDTSLLSDLASTKFTTTTVSGKLVIQAEPKADVVRRLGRSPDRGDAVVMAFTKGGNNASWQPEPERDIRVIRSHQKKRDFLKR